MKYLLFGTVIVCAVVVGFFLGRYSFSGTSDLNLAENTTIIRDTVIKEKTIKYIKPDHSNEESVEIELLDTLTGIEDTLESEEIILDTLDSDLSISREKLLKKANLKVSYINEPSNELDSTLQESLGITSAKNKFIAIEFWESPLNFEGYKLSKSKLILYGVTTQFDFDFVRNGNKSYLSSDEISYVLIESDKFQPLKIVSNQVVYGD